ncbi:formyl transferase [Lentisalinibacter sediminis]|uniref:formyl transferase n=1 Tax=Lentisalinibacter sediminis TaxID=2992237 RepID=UPI00386993E1
MEMRELRVVVIVSTDPSDLFFANQLARRFALAGILLEHQRDAPDRRPRWRKLLGLLGRPRELSARLVEFVSGRWHRWVSRNLLGVQSSDFGEEGRRLDPALDVPVKRIEGTGRLNDPECVEWLRGRRPDLVAVCGASLLKPEMLSVPSHGVLNLHGGLAQYYRGLFTTDWAILENEPEKVGATVHFVSPGIDDGGVVFQGRPHLELDDHPNRAYEKVVKLGVEMMSTAIRAIANGELHPCPEPPRGRLCRARDFTYANHRRLWRQWRRVMATYDADKQRRDASVADSLINPFEESVNRVEWSEEKPAGGRTNGSI